MKSIFVPLFMLLPLLCNATDIEINAENFPNEAFRSYVSTTFDTDNSGTLSSTEISSATSINCNSNTSITDITGVKNFTQLQTLICYSDALTSLDVSGMENLNSINCHGNSITSINVTNCPSLSTLYCYTNKISSISFSGSTNLTYLDCHSNSISSIDISALTKLTQLDINDNALTSLDLSGCTSLNVLDCSDNQLSSIDLSANHDLTYFLITGNVRQIEAYKYLDGDNNYVCFISSADLVNALSPGFSIANVQSWTNASIDNRKNVILDQSTNTVSYVYSTGYTPSARADDTTDFTTATFSFNWEANTIVSAINQAERDTDKPIEIFTLQGYRIPSSLIQDLPHGIYIIRQGNSIKKVVR